MQLHTAFLKQTGVGGISETQDQFILCNEAEFSYKLCVLFLFRAARRGAMLLGHPVPQPCSSGSTRQHPWKISVPLGHTAVWLASVLAGFNGVPPSGKKQTTKPCTHLEALSHRTSRAGWDPRGSSPTHPEQSDLSTSLK